MQVDLHTLLKDYGLDDKEIKVYLYLVGDNGLTSYNIAKATKIHRSTCYDILDRLISKGFVSKIDRQNKTYYISNEISKIIGNLKNKETILLNIIPRLQQLEEKQETNVKFMENPESQKEFNIKLVNLGKQGKLSFLYILGNTPSPTKVQEFLLERHIREVVKNRLEKGGDYKGIWNPKYKNHEFFKMYKRLGENRFIDNIPSKTTTIIFDNHVAFLYGSENPQVIEIKNKDIANEMKVYFEYLWKIAKS